MNAYTVEIQASNDQREVWQALMPAETVDLADYGPGATAETIARDTATNQNVADGDHWRIVVWEGDDADTADEPAYVLNSEDVD